MKLLIVSVLVAAIIAWASCKTLVTPSCPANTCPTGTPCCAWFPPGSATVENQCYSSTLYDCVTDQALSGSLCLCPKGNICCQKNCYAPAIGSCVNNVGSGGTGKKFCAAGATGLSCNELCYNPSVFHCPANQFGTSSNCLCSVGYNCCNGACYSPGLFTCCSDGALVPLGRTCAVP